MTEGLRIQRMEADAASLWLRMAFFAANPGVDAEDDWGIELPQDVASQPTPDADCLTLRTISF
jgi:hypothetical protein